MCSKIHHENFWKLNMADQIWTSCGMLWQASRSVTHSLTAQDESCMANGPAIGQQRLSSALSSGGGGPWFDPMWG